MSVSGLDGSGKTTVIEGLRRSLEAEGIPTRYVWLRYNHYLTKILLGLCRILKLTRYEEIDGVRVGYHDFYRSRIISQLFITLTFIDTLIASTLLVYLPALFSKSVIICDRWVIDIMVDLETDTHIRIEPTTWAWRILRSLLSRNTLCLFIDRDVDALKSARKENVYDENFDRRLMLYQRHASTPIMEVVKNDAEVQETICSVHARVKGVFGFGENGSVNP